MIIFLVFSPMYPPSNANIILIKIRFVAASTGPITIKTPIIYGMVGTIPINGLFLLESKTVIKPPKNAPIPNDAEITTKGEWK